MDSIYSLHEREYGCKPEVVVKAPAKINLMGEHTEQVEGCILALTLDKNISVAISKRKDKSLMFFSGNTNERKRSTVTGLKYKKDDKWANYLKGVVSMLLQSGCNISGFNLTLYNDIPPGIGKSSPSAMTVALTVALKNVFDLTLADMQIVEISRQAELRYQNSSNDQVISSPYVIFHSQKDVAVFLNIEKLEPEFIDFAQNGEAKIVITNSNLPALLTNKEIDFFHSEWRKSFELIRQRKKTSINNLNSDDFEIGLEDISERIRRCFLHLVDENQRVMDMRDALKLNDFRKMGVLMKRGHESARDLMEISCPELDWLVKRSFETKGAYGARMIGDGFGGSTIMLMDVDRIEEYESYLEEYEHIFGFKADYFICDTSPGIQILK